MKLYYTPGACSLSPHIVLQELGYDFKLEKVDLKTKKTESGKDYNAINEKGYVPYLTLDNGESLSEGIAIVQYLADQKPESGLAPEAGTLERARLNEWLAYISTELHKGFAPLFGNPSENAAATIKERLLKRLEFVDRKLQGKQFLLGNHFTVADAYLFTILNWAKPTQVDISTYRNLTAFIKNISARPNVQKALKEEGLLKAA